MEPAIVLFDGECSFCDRSVNFIIARDPQKHFRFLPLQTARGRAVCKACGCGENLDTMVLVEGESCSTKSTAALRIARRLSGGWPLLYVFIVVPGFIRNFAYGIFARNRYRWFGKVDACKVPTPEVRERFLEDGSGV